MVSQRLSSVENWMQSLSNICIPVVTYTSWLCIGDWHTFVDKNADQCYWHEFASSH